MNYREDLEIKLQKVTLAIQEVVEDVYKTEQEKQKIIGKLIDLKEAIICLLYTSPSPRDGLLSRMPSSA